MSALEPVQMERLREIGHLLRQKREAKGMALEDASAKTLIRPAILKAIEEADVRPLPEPVYLRGFIRRYADLLDLPGLQLADSFPWQPSQVVPAAFVASAVTTVDSVDDQPRRPFSAPRSEAREVAPEPVEANWLQQPEPEPEPETGAETETVQSDWMGFDSAESGALLPESLPEWEPTLPSTIQAADAWDQSVVSEPARPSSTEPVVPNLDRLEVPSSTEAQAATDVESRMPLARRPVENDPPAPLPMPRLPQGSVQPRSRQVGRPP
ncbi:MAG: helix-turn-helix domain-containing protein [Synechococcales cyanobacterium CRU_2_2]|nr:helix-turn-helix domain-containing protein [Synechococcales cyanobacterium CRU_2_2]